MTLPLIATTTGLKIGNVPLNPPKEWTHSSHWSCEQSSKCGTECELGVEWMESRISRFTIGIGESSWGLNLSLFVFWGPHRVLLSVLYGSSSAKLAKTTLSLCKDLVVHCWNSLVPCVMCSIGVDCVLQHMWKLIRSGFCSPLNPSISDSSFTIAGKSWSAERAKEDPGFSFLSY